MDTTLPYYFQHFLKWKEFKLSNPDYPILTIRYEDLLADPVNMIKKLAKFLENPYSDELIEEIAANTQFDQMKTQKESIHNPYLPYFKDGKDIMYRKGVKADTRLAVASSPFIFENSGMSEQNDNSEDEKPYIVQDAGGDTLSFKKIRDRILISPVTKASWDGVKSAELRKSDVLATSYVKSGSHYVYEIISMLQRGSSEPIPNVMDVNLIDLISCEQITNIPSPRTMVTHRYVDELPIDMISKKCKLVQVVRNPQDVCVSYFHHLTKLKSVSYDGKFSNFIPLFLKGEVPFGGWIEHFLKWKEFKLSNPDYPILTIRYEDLLADPVNMIKKLAKFLEKEYSDELIDEIAANTQFDQMKTQKESIHNPYLPYFKDGKDIMYRKGKTGDWKNHFSPSEAEEFDEYYRDKLEKTDYIYLNDS